MKIYVSAYTEDHTTHVQFVVNAVSHDSAMNKATTLANSSLSYLDIRCIETYTYPSVHMDERIQSHVVRVHGKVCNGKVLVGHGNSRIGYPVRCSISLYNDTPGSTRTNPMLSTIA